MLLLTVLVVGLFVAYKGDAANPHQLSAPMPGTVDTGTIKSFVPPETAKKIKFGIEILDIDSLNVADMTFQANGWYWLKWDQTVQEVLIRNGINPRDVAQPLNLSRAWFSSFRYLEGGVKLAKEASEYSLLCKFSGEFFFHDLDQSRAPFVDLMIPIQFEIEPSVLAVGGVDEVFLVPDVASGDGALGSFADLSGFVKESASSYGYLHRHLSRFGGVDGASAYSGVQLDVFYSISFWAAFVEFAIPPLLVFVVLVLSPLIDPSLSEFRLSVPVTSILSLVVLMSFANERFPASAEPSFLDLMYVYMFLASAFVFLLFVWSSNQIRDMEIDGEIGPEVTARISRVERIAQVGCIAGLLISGVCEWMT